MRGVKIKTEDTLFGKVLKARQDWRCERCGAKHEPGSMGLHISHFIGRAWHTTRWDEDNVDVFCYGCHQFMETHKGDQYREWKIRKLGEGRFRGLVERGRTPNKPSPQELKALRKKWREELKEL